MQAFSDTPKPALTQSDAVASLLSLSLAASSAAPIPVPSAAPGTAAAEQNAPQSAAGSIGSSIKTHRRLASTGKTKRRLSDAREAAARPSPAILQAASAQSAAALSLASLSLSSSPPSSHAVPHVSGSFTGASRVLAPAPPPPASLKDESSGIPVSSPVDEQPSAAIPINVNGKYAKKRGMDHKCESCSKIYRHPSCLIKHRWEHTPHWREASKFVLSKHQQVQLLEAAAILSHLSPSASGGRSLPDDRSLWPSFLSGGSLPPPEPPLPATTTTTSTDNATTTTTNPDSTSTSPYPSHYPVSSSVPASSALGYGFKRSTSAGPRLHDYSVPSSAAGGTGGITQLRPGLVGVPTGSPGIIVAPTAPMPVPAVPNSHTRDSSSFAGYRSAGAHSGSWASNDLHTASSYKSTGGGGGQGWSLPRSSLRSESRSRSASRSDEEEESVDVDVDVDVEEDEEEEYHHHNVSHAAYGGRYSKSFRRMWKREDEDEFNVAFSVREEDEDEGVVVAAGAAGGRKHQDWDGMEMDMDMD